MNMKKLSLGLAFLIVLIIWSTIPLAIKWSTTETPMGSAFLRMVFGCLFSVFVLGLTRSKLPLNKQAVTLYMFSSLSIFICMSLFYLAAQQIPSGWIAVLFGLSPLLTGLFSAFIEPDTKLTLVRFFGVMLGFAGLYLVFSAGLNLEDASLIGVLYCLLATTLSSIASVINRQLVNTANVSGLQATTGSIIASLPLFAIAAYFTQSGPIFSTNLLSEKALLSTIYLGVVATGIGFSLHYYLLKNITANRVALITLVTPIAALMIGSTIDNEPLVVEVWLGACLVCAGLLIYEFKPRLGLRKLSL